MPSQFTSTLLTKTLAVLSSIALYFLAAFTSQALAIFWLFALTESFLFLPFPTIFKWKTILLEPGITITSRLLSSNRKNELRLPHTNPIQLLALDRRMKVIPILQICSHPASSLTLVSANLSTVNKWIDLPACSDARNRLDVEIRLGFCFH